MNYSLAKELKDAGFPQRFDELHPFSISELGINTYDEHSHTAIKEGFVSLPTLSELIEACGGEFQYLKRVAGMWHCYNDRNGTVDGALNYPSPEEAVAKYWLALNKK